MALHPDTQDYLDRLATAGGTISTFNTNLLDTIIVALHAGGLRGGSNPLRYWIRLNQTESFTGSLVPVYDDGVGNATNVGSFTSSNWDATNGLTNDGSSRYLDSNWNPTTKLGTLSSSSCSIHIGTWQTVCTLNPAGFQKSGFQAGANDNIAFNDYHQLYLQADGDVVSLNADSFTGASSTLIYDQTAIGYTILNRVSPTSCRILLNNTLLGTIGTVSGSMVSPDFDYPLMAVNDPSAGVTDHARGSFKDFTFGTGLTTDQETALYNALSTTEPAPSTYYASPLVLAFGT